MAQASATEVPPTISVPEAGDLLGISRKSAYRAAHRGEIPVLKFGKRLVVPTDRLVAMLSRAAPTTAGTTPDA